MSLILQLFLANILSISFGITEGFVGCPCTPSDSEDTIHECERIIDSTCHNFLSMLSNYCCSGIDECYSVTNNNIAGGFK